MALALNGQGSSNSFTIGSVETGLDPINGPINVSGLDSDNTLNVMDGASTDSRDCLLDRDFVQRLDKARIS